MKLSRHFIVLVYCWICLVIHLKGSAENEFIIEQFGKQQFSFVVEKWFQAKAKGFEEIKRNDFPSLYYFFGVALLQQEKSDEAISAFQYALLEYSNDSTSASHLGLIFQQRMDFAQARFYYELALSLGDSTSLVRLFHTNIWDCWWKDFEYLALDVRSFAQECLEEADRCQISDPFYLEFANIDPFIRRKIQEIGFNQMSMSSSSSIPMMLPPAATTSNKRVIKIGFLSSNFGYHTVVTLIRGFLEYLSQKPAVEVYCFSLEALKDSAVTGGWWKENISRSVYHFIPLNPSKLSLHEIAEEIRSQQLDVLVELNGQTAGSGLSSLIFRPAPIQISFLGSPVTTGAPFIDYYLSDRLMIPAEHAADYREKLLLLDRCSLVNDYAQVHPSYDNNILSTPRSYHPRHPSLSSSSSFSWLLPLLTPLQQRQFLKTKELFLLGSFANAQKLDPSILQVWSNLLQQRPSAILLWIEYPGFSSYFSHLRQVFQYYGVAAHRLVSLPLTDWFSHLSYKRAIDLLLDTPMKNGHSTGLDGYWIDLPVITTAARRSTEARAGEVLARSLKVELGLTFSLKDYEIVALEALGKSDLLDRWRKQLSLQRQHSLLFQTKSWTNTFHRMIEATIDIQAVRAEKGKPFHLFQLSTDGIES